MARQRKPPAEVGLGALEAALAQIPVMAERWTRAAHRKAFAEWQQRDTFPGLKHRFDQLPWSDLRASYQAKNQTGRFAPIKRVGAYGFSPRRRQVGVRGQRRVRLPGGALAVGATPAYVSTGAMRRELMKRKPKRGDSGGQMTATLSSKGPPRIITRFSLWHRSLALFGGQRGIARIDRVPEARTFPMKSYRDSVGRTGAFMMTVTKTISVPRITPSDTTYLQEWGWKTDEKEWIRRRSEQILAQTVRSAAFDKAGNLRSKYLPETEGAAA